MPNSAFMVKDFHATSSTKALMTHGFWKTKKPEFTYTFENYFHPYVGQLIEQLNKRSLRGLFDPTFHDGLNFDFFKSYYTLSTDALVKINYFPKTIDVSVGGPYANYNWELFFHIPLAIAVHLSRNQRFPEAQRWFHYIFDPTGDDVSPDVPKRYWKFSAFRNAGTTRRIEELLALLSKPDAECTTEELALKAEILAGYEGIKNHPFQPHRVARTRQLAYMYNVVMKYLDNLIAWGDHLFRQDTLETINEATQLYVFAANILGDRPEKVPLKGTVRPKTFAQLKAIGLDATGNALVELEGSFPFSFGIPSGTSVDAASGPLFGIGRTLYFCVPRNDKLLAYWDTVADRLFKIRHCMNIQGQVRPLALFDPPLDPGMLVKAAAAGIDIGAIVAGLNQPASPVRAQLLIQKAIELCAEVRGLGSALLSAIEKGDAEQLALLRQGHDIKIQQMQQDVRFLQWKQAQEATESLLRSRATVLERYKYYLRLLGKPVDGNLVPDSFSLDRRTLTEENFDEAYSVVVGQYEKEVPLQAYAALSLAGEVNPLVAVGVSGLGKLSLTTKEMGEFDHLTLGALLGAVSGIVDATTLGLAFIPDPDVNLQYWGLGGTVKIPVGTGIVRAVSTAAKLLQVAGGLEREYAALLARAAGYERRVDDWILQGNLAARELRQIGRQVISSLIGEQIARREYEMAQTQIADAQEVDRFLRDKFSSADFYAWMQAESSRHLYDYYLAAFDLGRRAEQTMKRELMRPELDGKTFVQFNYWDGGRRGLLSGEALYLDLKRMEMAYHEHNLREYELIKNVSLLQVDPLALIQLRATGRCTVRLPESLFDMDGPGHYFRRLKSVAVSVPCVTGPYVGVNLKVTQVKGTLRTSPLVGDDYSRDGAEDLRFQDSFGSVQSIVASSGQQDGGVFPGSADERYRPFENLPPIGEYQFELPANPSQGDPQQFDYDSISDVILHLSYTAREGGAQLRAAAMQQIKDLIESAQAAGVVRLFSMRHEFGSEWAAFLGQTPAANKRAELAFKLTAEHYPFWAQGRLNGVTRIDVFARSADPAAPGTLALADRADKADAQTKSDVLTRFPNLNGLFVGRLSNVAPPAQPTGDLKLYFDTQRLADLWLAVTWNG